MQTYTTHTCEQMNARTITHTHTQTPDATQNAICITNDGKKRSFLLLFNDKTNISIKEKDAKRKGETKKERKVFVILMILIAYPN